VKVQGRRHWGRGDVAGTWDGEAALGCHAAVLGVPIRASTVGTLSPGARVKNLAVMAKSRSILGTEFASLLS
jgi:hypothetical protein